MSLSKPTQNQNPAKKFIEWKGSEGMFKYYDKNISKEVELKTPLYIIVLDQLSTISGFSRSDNSGIYSNEIRSTNKEELLVKTKKGILAKGLYQEIKPKIIQAGGKYAKSVYAVLITGDKTHTELELVNFKFTGSSLEPFINAKIDDSGEVILLNKNPEQKQNGNTVYYEPIIKKLGKREDILEKAIAMDQELQQYLDVYFSNTVEANYNQPTQEIDHSTENLTTHNNLPTDRPQPPTDQELNEAFPDGMPF